MKKISVVLLAMVVLLCSVFTIGLTACADEDEGKEIISQVVIDKEYQEAYTVMMPQAILIDGRATIISIPHYEREKFILKIQVTYIDNTTKIKSIYTTQEVYSRVAIGEEWKG